MACLMPTILSLPWIGKESITGIAIGAVIAHRNLFKRTVEGYIQVDFQILASLDSFPIESKT